MSKTTFIFILSIVLAAAMIWVVLQLGKGDEGPVPGEFLEALNRDHIAVGSEHPAYNSNPPTSGWHYAEPAQTGIYDIELPDEMLVHNLEHGHVWIAYHPDLSADQVEQLASIAKRYASKIIMAPRSSNDSPIAIVAWEYLYKLDSVDSGSIQRFIKEHRGSGPEQVPDFGFKDFRNK